MGSWISKQHPFIAIDVRANEEKVCMQYREGKDVWLRQRGEGCGVDNGLDNGRVDVVVDRVRVGVVVDDVDIGCPRQYNK